MAWKFNNESLIYLQIDAIKMQIARAPWMGDQVPAVRELADCRCESEYDAESTFGVRTRRRVPIRRVIAWAICSRTKSRRNEVCESRN